ncbi:hypothetical protein C8Q75DRAFT_805257 [Abortiporus biennis]|nr:hypothetical protein C8Q75DRAFT_805257 [Abortiporus biennis]
MFVKSALISLLSVMVAVANAAPSPDDASVTPLSSDPVSTFTATKLYNTLLKVDPFLTVATSTIVWTETVSATPTSV